MKYKIKKKLKQRLLAYKPNQQVTQYLLLLANADGVICAVKKLKRTHGCFAAPGINSAVLTQEYTEAQQQKLDIAGVYFVPPRYDHHQEWNSLMERNYVHSRTFRFPVDCVLFMINETCYDVSTNPFVEYTPEVIDEI